MSPRAGRVYRWAHAAPIDVELLVAGQPQGVGAVPLLELQGHDAHAGQVKARQLPLSVSGGGEGVTDPAKCGVPQDCIGR